MMQEFNFKCHHSEDLLKKLIFLNSNSNGVLNKPEIIESNLVHFPIVKIIQSLDSLSRKLIKNKKTASVIAAYELGFLIPFLRKRNLENIIKLNFNDISKLDNPLPVSKSKSIFLQPRGTLVHWISGNMPVLGFISLVCGIITKNINIVKLPSKSYEDFLDLFNLIVNEKDFIKEKFLFENVIPITVNKDHEIELNKLSMLADTRIFWGGKEGLEMIRSLSRKVDSNDLIMGPKLSSALVSLDYFKKLNVTSREELLNNIVKDIVTGNQRGCNSPHFIYLLGSHNDDQPRHFIDALDKSFKTTLSKNSKLQASPVERFNVLSETFNFVSNSSGQVRGSVNDQYKVFLYENNDNLSTFDSPAYGNTVFVQLCESLDDILYQSNPQTISVSIFEEHQELITTQLIRLGFLRIVKPGSMSAYDHPWDGLMPLNDLVKYISISL